MQSSITRVTCYIRMLRQPLNRMRSIINRMPLLPRVRVITDSSPAHLHYLMDLRKGFGLRWSSASHPPNRPYGGSLALGRRFWLQLSSDSSLANAIIRDTRRNLCGPLSSQASRPKSALFLRTPLPSPTCSSFLGQDQFFHD